MLTVQTLDAWGADTAQGIGRCVNDREFYLRMVRRAAADTGFEKLQAALEAEDLSTAFEAAHALKGICANLALTPLSRPVSEITELLRARTDTDYSALMAEIMEQKAKLDALF